MDPSWAVDKVIEVIKLIIEMREAAISNRERCGFLCCRLASIAEVLEMPTNRARLLTPTPPKSLTNLQETVEACKSFVERYCMKSKLMQFGASLGIEGDFQKLNDRLNSCLQDFLAFLATTIDSNTQALNQQKLAPTIEPVNEKDFERDTLIQVDRDPETLLIIRIQPSPDAEAALCYKLSTLQPNLRWIHRSSLEDALALFNSWRSMPTARVRVVLNRSFFVGGQISPTAGVDFSRRLRAMNYKIPILLYTSPERIPEFQAMKVETTLAPFTVTVDQKVLETFCLMATLLWVDPNDNDDNREIDRAARDAGVTVVRKNTTTEGVRFLQENPHLISFMRDFRVITNRARPSETPGGPFNLNAAADLISNIRGLCKCNAPVLVFTSSTNLNTVRHLESSYSRVKITDFKEVALSFAKMTPLPDDPPAFQAKPLFASSNALPLPKAFGSVHQTPVSSSSSMEPGTLQFIKLSCSSLAPKDLNGSSDPYVIISNGKRNVRTFTIMEELNPTWNVVPSLPGCSPTDTITFDVFDYDAIGSDDFEGSCNFSLQAFPKGARSEITIPLGPKKGFSGKVTGKLSAIFILH